MEELVTAMELKKRTSLVRRMRWRAACLYWPASLRHSAARTAQRVAQLVALHVCRYVVSAVSR